MLVHWLGRPTALVASGLLLSVIVLGVAIVLARWIGLPSRPGPATLGAGLLWLGLTLAFEFGFGRGVQGRSWGELLQAYTFEGGNRSAETASGEVRSPAVAIAWPQPAVVASYSCPEGG